MPSDPQPKGSQRTFGDPGHLAVGLSYVAWLGLAVLILLAGLSRHPHRPMAEPLRTSGSPRPCPARSSMHPRWSGAGSGGRATDLAISAVGIVYSLDQEGRLWRCRGSTCGWSLMPRRFKRVAAGPDGKPVAIGTDDLVCRYNGLWWDAFGTASVRDLAAGADGQLLAISTEGTLDRVAAARRDRSSWRYPFAALSGW